MKIVDDRGRLFGRLNIVDLLVVAGLTLLAVAIYSTARSARPVPVPTLTSVEPASVLMGTETHLTLHGRDLRPLIKVGTGVSAVDIFTASGTLASITLPPLPAGTYDLMLYDQGQEMSRLPKAVTVVARPMPTVDVQAVGTFTLLNEPATGMVAVGASLPNDADPVARVLAVEAPEPAVRRLRIGDGWVFTPVAGKRQVPAIIRLRCTTVGDDCLVGDTVLGPGAAIALPVSGGAVAFVVDEVRAVDAPVVFPKKRPLASRAAR